ncbi:MAG TPA: hypothetical protein VF691_19510, partial [Cytophagaceae bacterium]
RCTTENLVITIQRTKPLPEFLILVGLVLLPYLMVLAASKGNFTVALYSFPFSLIIILMVIYYKLKMDRWDNDVVIDFRNSFIEISNKHFGSRKDKFLIAFDQIESFKSEHIRDGKSSFNLFWVILNDSSKIIVQEFDSADKASIIMNELFKMRSAIKNREHEVYVTNLSLR